MLPIWFLLMFVMLFTLISYQIGDVRTLKSINGTSLLIKKPNKYVVILISFFLIIISGLRSGIGDTGYYMYAYKYLAPFDANIIEQRDFGFTIFQHVLRSIVEHPQFLLFSAALITNTFIIFVLYKYSLNFILSLFMYIASGIYLSTMNGLRQYLVASIIFLASHYLFEKQFKKYFIIIVLCSSIHASALVMIPIYFLVHNKAWTKKTVYFLIFSFLIVIGFDNIFPLFSNILGETQYSNYLSTFGNEYYQGASAFRTIIAAVPVILSFIYRKKLSEFLRYYDILTNLALINLLIMSLSLYNWIFARLSIYLELYNLLLLVAILTISFNKREKPIIYYLFFLAYSYVLFNLPYIYSSYYLNINIEDIGILTGSFY